MTLPKMTCPLPHAPPTCVPSLDHAKLKMLPVLGFSNAYDHWKKYIQTTLALRSFFKFLVVPLDFGHVWCLLTIVNLRFSLHFVCHCSWLFPEPVPPF